VLAMPMKYKITVGDNVLSFRKEKGWSQKQLALMAGFKFPYLSNKENNKGDFKFTEVETLAN
jgi:transcriptional regulator with XRE-family HTH domain